MKRFLIIFVVFAMLLMLVSCGNKQVIDATYKFDKAIVKMPSGEVMEIELKKWGDYDGEQLQLVSTDDTVYLVSSYNCVLMAD